LSENIAIIDYGSGNLKSAQKALLRAGNELETPPNIIVSSNPEIILKADRIVLPGVGSFADCKQGLLSIEGIEEILIERVIKQGVPFLGICVGMQLMADFGEEKGKHKGLGWISGTVKKIAPKDSKLKIPHMGWNELIFKQKHVLLKNIDNGKNGQHAYFVHSYHFEANEKQDIIATCDYGGDITAMIAKDNMVGVQFHPEKSQALGLKLLENFLRWQT